MASLAEYVRKARAQQLIPAEPAKPMRAAIHDSDVLDMCDAGTLIEDSEGDVWRKLRSNLWLLVRHHGERDPEETRPRDSLELINKWAPFTIVDEY